MGKLARAAFFLLALPAVARASVRVAWLARRLPLDALVVRLRAVPPFALRPLARPDWLLATLDRLLPVLPPLGHGRCLKRSLLLLDLWSRCGLHPRLHLGVRLGSPLQSAGGRHEGHAWVTVVAATAEAANDGPSTVDGLGTSSEGYPEAFVL